MTAMKGFTREQDEPVDAEPMFLEGTRAIHTRAAHPGADRAADSRPRSLSTKGHLGSTRSPRGAPALASARSPPAPAKVSTSKRTDGLGSSARAPKKRDARLVLPFAYDDDDPRVAHLESVAGLELPQFRARSAAWSSPAPPVPSYWG